MEKKEIIKVEKEDFDLVVKKIVEIENRLNSLMPPTDVSNAYVKLPQADATPLVSDYFFESQAVFVTDDPQNLVEFQGKKANADIFRKELEELCKKYHIIKCTGEFLHKI